jgi:hypothetical protein
MEPFTWLILLAAWSLLLLLGLAGGDPLAPGRPGREAPLVKAATALSHRLSRGRADAARPTPRQVSAPRDPAPRHPSESGLHALA